MSIRTSLVPAFAVACSAAFLPACSTSPTQPAAPPAAAVSQDDANASFRRHVDAVLEEMWKTFPEQAIRAGNYKYAGKLTVPDAERRAEAIAFYDRQLAALARIDVATLDASNRVDHGLMKSRFESRRWYLTTFRNWQWQPSTYNVGSEFGVILNTNFAPLDARLRLVIERLEKVPAYYAAAQASVADPTLEYTTLAIVQNRGALRGFGEDLQAKVAASGLTADEKALFATRVAAARVAIGDYLSFLGALEAKLKAGPARSFRIGKALYEQKFAYDIQSGFTVDSLHKRALAEKAALHDAMEVKARELWPRVMGGKPMPADRLVMIRAVLDQLSLKHTTREKFVETIRAQIPSLEKFVREKDLLDQDPTRPLLVRETPLYMRGVGAGASVSSPGPFDPKANTYYNVTPPEGLTDEQTESFLREYNDWTLQILNIHEAIPGHYLQLVHANKSPSVVKSLFGNGAMIEGWAVFSEKVMLDAGYDNFSPEIWLFWMKWNLRSVVNTILDIEIQTMGLEREAAMTMMTREAFQQDREATEKWLRATLSQVQLTSYFNGYAEITALRDELRAKQGAKFSVKGFNNRFLSYGSAPVRDIAKLMR
ncbi:DUF885 domain-containing protein [Usitatibacter palustris]|uniref:DUF885 domain-containing protein n=1 Tax=Usitatibacter palustris TaxID=2732487 RepID=A0A6M4H7I1_9PROT|nr:DUF885 domain-containing protein [Usitatibacter palustris]QJR15591.1 hypothetical protein DSM104440_02413 [Usitatibacter palustris]